MVLTPDRAATRHKRHARTSLVILAMLISFPVDAAGSESDLISDRVSPPPPLPACGRGCRCSHNATVANCSFANLARVPPFPATMRVLVLDWNHIARLDDRLGAPPTSVSGSRAPITSGATSGSDFTAPPVSGSDLGALPNSSSGLETPSNSGFGSDAPLTSGSGLGALHVSASGLKAPATFGSGQKALPISGFDLEAQSTSSAGPGSLSISGSGLEAPRTSGSGSRVQMLSVSHNNVSEISATALRGLSDLVHLRLDHNRITGLPAAIFADTPSLGALSIAANPRLDVASLGRALAPARLALLRLLDLSAVDAVVADGRLPEVVFARLPALQQLVLRDVTIANMSAEFFTAMSGVVKFYLLSFSCRQFLANVGILTKVLALCSDDSEVHDFFLYLSFMCNSVVTCSLCL